MSLLGMFLGAGASGFGYNSTAEDVTTGVSLDGKTILVTGCNSGLGLETLRVLALRGAHVIGTARTEGKAKAACASVSGRTTGVACELSDPKSVRACAAAVRDKHAKLDAIICNAGIMALPKLEQAHGCELQFFTNHIGHFILVNDLLPGLADTGRVVMLSSEAHRQAPKGGIRFDNLGGEKSYGPWVAYGQSKFANILFAKELARRFSGTKKTANAVHPGVIRTNLARSMNPVQRTVFHTIGPLFLKTIPQGAATTCYVAVHPSVAAVSGAYFSHSNVVRPRADAEDLAVAKKLWEISEQIVGRLP